MFSHGLFAQKVHYSGLHKDLASHGYIVFAINHADGSCMHTQNSRGEPIPHGSFTYYVKDYRRQ